jgi:hypothetical protein
MLGIVGWYINANLAKRANVNRTASRVFERTVPILRYLEKRAGKWVGLSMISYLRK